MNPILLVLAVLPTLVVPPQPARPVQGGEEAGAPNMVRRDIEIPWGCAGLTSVVQIPRVSGEIRRIAGVACVYTSCGDILRIPPFLSVYGPPPLQPTLVVHRFVIEDDPAVFARLEGTGTATFWGDRKDGSGPHTCSGARLHLFIELEP